MNLQTVPTTSSAYLILLTIQPIGYSARDDDMITPNISLYWIKTEMFKQTYFNSILCTVRYFVLTDLDSFVLPPAGYSRKGTCAANARLSSLPHVRFLRISQTRYCRGIDHVRLCITHSRVRFRTKFARSQNRVLFIYSNLSVPLEIKHLRGAHMDVTLEVCSKINSTIPQMVHVLLTRSFFACWFVCHRTYPNPIIQPHKEDAMRSSHG